MADRPETWRIELITPGGSKNETIQEGCRFKPSKEYVLRIARQRGAEKGEGVYTIINVDPVGKEKVEAEYDVLPDAINNANTPSSMAVPGGVAYLPPPPQATPVKETLEETYSRLIQAGDMEKAQNILIAMRMKEDSRARERAALMGTSDEGRGSGPKSKSVDDMNVDELIQSVQKRKFLSLIQENKLDEALLEAGKWKGGGGAPNQQMPGMPGMPPGMATTGDPMLDAGAAYDSMAKRWLRMKGIDPETLPMGMGLHQNPDIAKWQLEDMKEARRESRQQAFYDKIMGVGEKLAGQVGPIIERLVPKQAGFGDINSYLQQQGQTAPPMGQPQAMPYPSPVLPGAPQRAVVQQGDAVYVGPGAAAVTPVAPQAAMPRPSPVMPRVPVQTGVSPVQVEEGATEVLGMLDEVVNAIVENNTNPSKSVPEDTIRTLNQLGALNQERLGKLMQLRQRGVRNLVSEYSSYISQLAAFPNIPTDQQVNVMKALRAYRPKRFDEIVRIKQALTQSNPGYDPNSLAVMIRNQQTTIALPLVSELAAKLKVLTTPHAVQWIERAVEEAYRLGGANIPVAPMAALPLPPASVAPPSPENFRGAPNPPTADELIAMERTNPRAAGARVPTVHNTAPTMDARRVPPGFEQDAMQDMQEAQMAAPQAPLPPPPVPVQYLPPPSPTPQPVTPKGPTLPEAVYRSALKASFDELKNLLADNAHWLTPDELATYAGTIIKVEGEEISKMYRDGESLEAALQFAQFGLNSTRSEIAALKAKREAEHSMVSISMTPEVPPKAPEPAPAPTIAPKAPEPAPEAISIVEPVAPAPSEPEARPARITIGDGRKVKKPPCEHVNAAGKRCGHGWQVEVDGHKYCAPHAKEHRVKPSGGNA